VKRPEGFSATPTPTSTPNPSVPKKTPKKLATPPPVKTTVTKGAAPDAVRTASASRRAAARTRRRDERAEVRRFTRRSRRRRLIVIGAAATAFVLVAGAALIAVSPLMSLRTIDVAGTTRLDAQAIGTALDGHLGTPLALLDSNTIRDDLAIFPLIRSFSTEVVPPHTLVVRVIERAPVGAVERGAVIDLLDAAGVVVETFAERPAGIPLIAAESADSSSLAFRSVAAVLISLPDDVRAQVDVIRASTRDDVTFTMSGTGHRVVWGSSERSAFKARVLASAIAVTGGAQAWEFDVSAPESLVVRQL
jgi:cell division protein FtsQ